MRYKYELIGALLKEIDKRKNYLEGAPVKTIYFGGGTPSILETKNLKLLIDRIQETFNPEREVELTIEANPDDIDEKKLTDWKNLGINRLSIGIQSFFDEDLAWMNRAHNSKQSLHCIEISRKYFTNITIDLIYGTPLTTQKRWNQNLEKAIQFEIPHLSCYALTVEPKTPLDKMIRHKLKAPVDPDKQSEQFLITMQKLTEAGYEHYEISNFAKPGFRSRHNSSYWLGEKYIGLGPSAHSYNGKSRQWNVSNNSVYIKSLNENSLTCESEILTPVQKINEYIMTTLRTCGGINLEKLDKSKQKIIGQRSIKYIESGLMERQQDCLILTNTGKLLADGIAADLFF